MTAHNGMVVNANIWNESQNEHRAQRDLQRLVMTGPGIITGLEVYPEPTASRDVWIQPGFAVDAYGRLIIVSEKSGYQLKPDNEGVIYLLLESRSDEVSGNSSKEPNQKRLGYVIKTSNKLTDTGIELARFILWGRNSPITEARNAEFPKENEIDLRFRRQFNIEWAKLGVIGLEKPTSDLLGKGLAYLAQAINQDYRCRVWLEDVVDLNQDLSSYSMLYFVENMKGQTLQPEQLNKLAEYGQNGGSIFIESDYPIEASPFIQTLQLQQKFETILKPTTIEQHPILFKPHLFIAPPPGWSLQGETYISDNRGIIFSTCHYGRLWQRQSRYDNSVPSRSEVRDTLEWGHNIVHYAVKRQQRQYGNLIVNYLKNQI